jgi:glutamate/tyrosine decarboxylase-like PLP-dependent enzyme
MIASSSVAIFPPPAIFDGIINVGASYDRHLNDDHVGGTVTVSREATASIPETAHQKIAVDMPPAEFAALGHEAVDRLAVFFESLTGEHQPRVFPTKTPVEIAPLFAKPVPEIGEPLATILADWDQKILPHSTPQGHPRFFSWVNGGSSQVGALAELLAAGLNPNLGGWRAAPAASVIEHQTITWLAELLGLSEATTGIFLSGGTMANTTALRMALSDAADWDLRAEGLQGGHRLTIYMGDHEAHISLTRAVDTLGLGRNAIRLVPSHADFTIDLVALERMILADRAAGMQPFAIVGHAGSINVGAIDDLTGLAEIAERQDLWFHIDGACGALGAMLPELRAAYAGMDRADTVSFDAHKWLGVPYEAGCLLIRDPAAAKSTWAIQASYLHEAEGDENARYDFFDRGPQMSRGWRALKVWMSLRYYGAEGYRQFFRRTIDNAKYAHELVLASSDFEAVQGEPQLYIYSFRFNPAASELTDAELDQLNFQIADEMKSSGVALVMTTRVHGQVCQRLSIANHRTERHDIEATLSGMAAIGRRLLAKRQ